MPDKIISILIIFFLSIRIYSQEIPVQDVISAVAEELAADESNPEAAEIYVELLNDLAEDPVQINSKDNSELERLFFLSTFQIRSLADYTVSTGRIVSPYEIANIPGFDRETASMILPFITLSDNRSSSPDSAFFRSKMLTNITFRSTDIDTSAIGSPLKHLVKYRFTSGNISGGFTTEKDPGEKFLDVNTSFPDFLSAHMAYSGTGLIRKVIIGDFGARFGLGTNINTGIRTGQSLTIPFNVSGRNEIKPYTSTDENNFFRGIATQFQLRDLTLAVYYSSNKIDAAVSTSETGNTVFIESLYKTGLHNTPSSLLKKDALTETSSGANLSYRLKNLNIGLTYARHNLSLPVYPANRVPSDIYDFTGNRNQVISFTYKGLIRRIILAGEVSASRSKTAFVQSLSMRPADRLTINLLYRYYEPGYTAFHSNGPFSSSSGENLEGLFGSFTFEAAKYLFISAGCDIRQYPWMKYRCSAPSEGTKGELRIKYIPSEQLMAEFVYNKRFSVSDAPESDGISKQDETTDRAIKCLLKYSPVAGLILSSRADLKVVTPTGNRGMLLLQDINYRFSRIPVSIWFRHCIFNTGDWNSRIYAWENDLLYSFSIPALSGKGSRTYLVAGWKVWNRAEFRIKYGITTDYMTTNQDVQELRVQFRFGF